MTTSLYSLAEDLPIRLSEVREIASRAEKAFDKDNDLYDILCRAGFILQVSALEGFLKDVAVAIDSDINVNIAEFRDMPGTMKREFTKKIVRFEGVSDSDMNKRANQLLRFFEQNSVKIDMLAFPYKENANKNPSSDFIDGTFKRYGIVSILHCLAGSKFEAVFKNDSATDAVLMREIRRLRSTLYAFPYRAAPGSTISADWIPVKGAEIPNSLWQTFIEKMLLRRHNIVHAHTQDNPGSWKALSDDADKLEILFAGLMFAASTVLARNLR